LIDQRSFSLRSNLALYILTTWDMMCGHDRPTDPGLSCVTSAWRRLAYAVDGGCRRGVSSSARLRPDRHSARVAGLLRRSTRTDPLRLRFTIPLVVLVGLSTLAAAQQKYIRPLVYEPVDDRHRIVLKGNVHPMARPQFEVAGAPPDLRMDRMLMVLKRSPEQQTALSSC
jgi:hypothetical protein